MLLIFVALPLQMWGATNVYQGVSLKKPSSKGDTLLIYNREQLLWWALNDQKKSIKLMADINVQGNKQLLKADGKTLALGKNEIVVWPYVKWDSDRTWYGAMKPRKVINGNNHTISGIYQNYGYGVNSSIGAIEAYDYVGFLSWAAHDISIWDLNISDSYLVGKYAGGFLGQKSKNVTSTEVSEFRNCSFRGYVKGDIYAGGFTGWYRTDGQDAKFYRCFNYGTIEGGSASSTDKETSTGGLIGYLDIKRTSVAQAHTDFNRCVNYGNITCFTPGGSVGGSIGKIWDNNNGKRLWHFCFNFGEVTKYDMSKKSLIGSGLLGNYTNTNGNAKPKIIGCGNAKYSDTGALLDSLTWNYKSNEPFVVTGSKTMQSSKTYSSISKDDSWTSWINNHWGTVTIVAVIVAVTILTYGIATAYAASASSSLASMYATEAASVASSEAAAAAVTGSVSLESSFISVSSALAEAVAEAASATTFANAVAAEVSALASMYASVTAAATLAASMATMTTFLTALGGGAVAAGIIGGAAEAYNYYYKSQSNASNIIVNTNIPYASSDLKKGVFAFDANLMMQADSIDGEKNTDKSILFKQHFDANDTTKNEAIPSVVTNFNTNTDKLYFGYDRCSRIPIINNDPSLGKKPLAHTFDEHGECTYCHFVMLPLDAVYKADGQTVDYYAIKTPAQLNYLASAFNGDNEEAYKLYKGASFKLMNDIDYPENAMWSPIGSCTVDYKQGTTNSSSSNWHHFMGKFDGQGFNIKGLKTSANTNYAGLFGYVEGSETTTSISNVILSSSVFMGNVAGSIAGCINTDNSQSISKLRIEKAAADSSVIVICAGYDKNSYAGGLFGIVERGQNENKELTVSCCYNNVCLQNLSLCEESRKTEEVLGTFTGLYSFKATESETKPTFQHCYYGGISLAYQTMVKPKGRSIEKYDLDDCYSIGFRTETIQNSSTAYYISGNYINSGRLAYDLMENSKVTENGETTYFFTQKGNFPVLTNTKQPTLCKVKVGERNTGVQIADTIININATKLAAPIEYAGQKFDKAVLYGWNNENCEGDPAYKGQLNDFSELYKTPARHYAIVFNPEDIPAIANIQSETEWKGAGVLAGYQQTNILKDLYLQGNTAWSLQLAPQCIDGNNKTVSAGMPIISNVEDATSAARRYSRARGARASASQTSADITIQNLRVQTDIMTQDVLSKGARKLNLNNLILEPVDADETIFDWNSETKTANTAGLNLKNVVCRKKDSTSVAFYKNGTDVMATTFSDKDKNNDYEHVLGYMLSQDGMLDVFGLRLSGKNEKVAGKLGFASEESKHIYRVKTYSQSTGLADGEILMNYDGNVTFDVKGTRVGAMHEGLPDGTFAVLPLTKEELGNRFKNLGKNIITKDGKAACIRLEEGKTDGFAYPACFDANQKLILSADRIEYVRKVHRDGLHETIYLPCAFNSVEFDEKDFNDEDQVEISFLNLHSDEEGTSSTNSGLSNDGKSIDLVSLRSYYAKKYADGYDPSQDDDITDIFRQAFYAGIPYMIALKCAERTDELSTVTFVGTNGEYSIGFLREEGAIDPEDLFAPLYGTFHTKTAGEVANGMKIFGLDVFTDEETGNLYDKFVRLKDTERIEAFRCFIATNSSLVGDDISIKVDDNTTTGIKDVKVSDLKKNGKIFDLSGRRVMKKTPRNIYIQNGKKVVNF